MLDTLRRRALEDDICEGCFQLEFQAQSVQEGRCAILVQLRQPGHIERIPVQVPVVDFTHEQTLLVLEWLELDANIEASDCCHARVLGADGRTQQVLSFTVTKKKKLVFPMTVTVPSVGKVTIEHAGPRPAHVKDRPKVRQCAEDVAAHWRTQNMVPGLLRARLLG